MSNQSERIFYLDSLRALLMMFGIVIHSFQVYNPQKVWLIYSENSLPASADIVHIIHLFRMPAFFVISGFFCAYTLRKYSIEKFISVRIKRIVIPMFSTVFLVNSIQSYILYQSGWSSYGVEDFFVRAGWLSHLWFLVNLVIYFITAATLVALIPTLLGKLKNAIHIIVDKVHVSLILILLPFLSFVIYSLKIIGFPLYDTFFEITNFYEILHYAPYFLFGIVLCHEKTLLKAFASLKSLLILSSCLVTLYLMTHSDLFSGFKLYLITTYYNELLIWLSVSLCFYIAATFFNSDSALWKSMSNASYTVYLFHHIIVISLGLLAIKLDLPPAIGVFILITATLIACFSLHKLVISRFDILRLLFNGK